MFGSGALSNAAKSKMAKDGSKKAEDASSLTAEDDWRTHDRAADAHHEAARLHQDAGNGTLADMHRAQGKVHAEKANAGRQLHYAAQDLSNNAHELTKKAEMGAIEQDDEDPRSESELHADAAVAHDKAAKMHDMAGNSREAKFHAMKADMHAEASKALGVKKQPAASEAQPMQPPRQ